MKIHRDELIRQLRANGADLIERWIAEALADDGFPDEFEVGGCLRFALHYHALPAPVRPTIPPDNRITCDNNCGASIEFQPGAAAELVSEVLARKHWRMGNQGGAELLMCPRCAPADTRT